MLVKLQTTGTFTYGNMTITMEEALSAWTQTLEKVFPTRATQEKDVLDTPVYTAGQCSCMQE